MEGLIEAATKRDLGWFLEEHLYQDRGLPDVRVQSAHPWKTEKETHMITVTLENLGPAGAEVPFTIHCEGGDVSRRLEVRSKERTTVRVDRAPLEIVVNDWQCAGKRPGE